MLDFPAIEVFRHQLDHLDILREDHDLQPSVERLVEDLIEDFGLG